MRHEDDVGLLSFFKSTSQEANLVLCQLGIQGILSEPAFGTLSAEL